MFGIGTSELLVVAVLALLLFPPKELPKIIRGVSQLWGSLRRTADEFRDAIMQEEAMQDLKDAVEGTKAQLRDVEGAARRELMKARMEARRAENKLLKVAKERERIEREAAAKAQGEAGAGAAPAGDAAAAVGSGAVGSGAVGPGAAQAASSAPASTPVAASKPVAASSPVASSSPAPANTVSAGSSVIGSGTGSGTGSAAEPDASANQGAA